VGQITPRLYLEGASESALAPDDIAARIEHHLRTQPPAWNPYE